MHSAPVQKNELFRNRFSRRVKTPTVIQMETMECGAASLAIVLGYWGKFVPLEELRVACGVSRDGSKASNIAKAARKYGLVVKACRYEPKELKSIPLPAIIHWNFNHFLVLEGFSGGLVCLNDPAGGPYRVTESEFDAAFTGVTLMLRPAPEFVRSGKKRTLFASIKKSLAGLSTPLTFLLLISFLLVFPGLLAPYFSKFFVDEILVGSADAWAIPFFLGLAVVALFQAGASLIRNRYMAKLQNALSNGFSGRFFRHLLRLPMEFFLQRFAGDIASRIAYNDIVSELITGRLASTALDLLTAVFFLAMMFVYSPLLALCGAGIALLNFIFMAHLSRKRANQQRKLLTDEGKFYGISTAGLEIIETMKAGGSESDFFARWAGYQAKLLNAEQQMGGTLQLLLAIPPLITLLDAAVVLALGAWKVIDAQMTLGTLVAFQGLLASFIGPINRLVGFGDEIQDLNVYLERLDDVYEYPATRTAAPPAEQADGGEKLAGRVEMTDISFGYSRLEPPLIEGFCMTLEPGAHVAVVGASGSGKSTLAKLAANLYAPWSGEILFDGRPRDGIPAGIFQRSFAMVDQEISIFEGTVRDNITLWNPAISDADVEAAARDARIHDVILEREGGYDLALGENGKSFSGGEKQRIEIARALAVNPTILVLDEATSALDPLVEKQIMDNIRRRGCACLIVAHRLSTIMDCDEIIVLDHGRVAERGTHAQLVALGGAYCKLVSNS